MSSFASPPSSQPPSDRALQLAESCRQSRRELWFMLGAWAFFCAWVLISAAVAAYGVEEQEASLVLGLPSWVSWGILLPWVTALLLTIWFAGWGMKDTEFESDEESEALNLEIPEEQ